MTLSKYLTLTIPAVSLLIAQASAQSNISWEANPKPHTVPDSVKTQSVVMILDERNINIVEEKGQTYQERTIHHIARLQDDKGLEGYKTLAIPSPNGAEIKNLRGRVILPDGVVRNVPESSIKELVNEKGTKEHLFAFEGLSKNAEVEYTYTDRRPLEYFGVEYFQYSVPIIESRFSLVTPAGYIWDSRSYNNFPKLQDSSRGNEHIYYAQSKNTTYLLEEEYSNHDVMRHRMEYKLSNVIGNGTDNVRLFTWNEVAKNLYANLASFTDKELKIASRFLTTMAVNSSEPTLQKAQKIEDYFKTNILIKEGLNSEKYADFDRIIKEKICDDRNFTRFMCACFTAADINYYVGTAPNRYSYTLDEEFENWKILEDYLIYFPASDAYMHPTAFNFRTPFLPPAYVGIKGIFAKPTSLGNMKSAVSVFRDIPAPSVKLTNHDVYADVQFTSDMTPVIKYKQVFQGYSSIGIRDYFLLGDKKEEKTFVVGLIGLVEKPEELKNYTVENVSFNSQWNNKPLELKADMETPHLVEKAGNKYIFKVGDLIGRQAELYSDEKRKLPIVIAFPHALHRELTIHIPEGYKVVNADDTKMKADAGKLASTLGFVSDYKIEGSTMTITIHENYDDLNYPLAEYEAYRRVINAAADFNKVVLTMEKI